MLRSEESKNFSRAADCFLAHFGLNHKLSPARDELFALYRAFTSLPYENVSKIIRTYAPRREGPPEFRTPEEVLEGYLTSRLGGTCFSLTHCLYTLLGYCGFSAWRVLGDMRHGPNIHCAVMVSLEGAEYLCDAGYLLPAPLPVDPRGKSVLKSPLYTYLLEPDKRMPETFNLYTLTHSGESRWRYRIRSRPAENREFEHHWRRSFSAPMNHQLLLSRSLESTQVYVHKNHLRLSLPGGRKNRNIHASLGPSIEELFGIEAALVEQARELVEKAREVERMAE